ncbi:hypothetical protein [Hydromonas duriensis]|uniref:Uncharacterized protein n=1 Tax=Hydromonas duriensis TaxID=1527608 RepID=A0A4R6Y497_9BURK|nr:hypothetical protein [Hydromonas duriensis]TDR27709.1 hypothetical protein DFR44_1456 [Hydromonas duriensis]
MNTKQFEQLKGLSKQLNLEHSIAIYRPLVTVLGSVKSALLLSQLIHWTGCGVDVVRHDGWFFKTSVELKEETGLTQYEQETARKQLKDLRVIEVSMRGKPAKPWIKVNLEGLSSIIAQTLNISPARVLTLDDIRMKSGAFKQLLANPLPYRPSLARIAGSVNAGLMLTCMVRCLETNRSQNISGFVTKHISDWTRETGLSYAEQFKARELLIKAQLIEERHLVLSREIYNFIRIDICIRKVRELQENQKTTLQGLKNHASGNMGDSSYGESLNTAMAKVEIQLRQKSKYSYGDSRNTAMAEVEIVKNIDNINLNNNKTKQPQPQNSSAEFTKTESPALEKNVVVVDEGINRLVWPDKWDGDIRALVFKVLKPIQVDEQQMVLDEVAGKPKHISNPVGYVRMLVNLMKENAFIPECAHRVRKNRELEAVRKQAEQQKREEPNVKASIEVQQAAMARLKGLRFKARV